MPSDTLAFLRDANWLNAKRVRAYSLILFAANAIGFAIWIGLARGGIDHSGKPIGTDFMSFYAASRLVLSGHAAEVWTPQAHQAAQDGIFGRQLGYWAFFYPPAYLLICAPLALLPYGVSLFAWLAGTTGAAIALARQWLKQQAPVVIGLIPLLAFPALWINIGNGQNAALTTAIFLGGCLWLDRRPVIAGLILGLIVIKPQLALALPFALAASGRWKTFLVTGFSAVMLSAAAWGLVGTEGYLNFLHNNALARATLENGLVSPARMQSLFAALRLWQAPLWLAYGAQAVLALGVIASACLVIRRHRPDRFALAALLVSATLLMSPFMLDYDLLLSAIPLGWLVMSGLKDGFRSWEKTAALVMFVWPLFARSLALNLHLPLTPLILLVFYVMVVRRIADTPTSH
ncbi:MAG: glycosyltransferase family 87 protein [Asticcacaulis sp.]|uniref:glycosyltransferase family 87 protein n=1 Tax=Asticcacaulis sp. TaxID=1872648 RepID=UPI0039E23ED1